jgi:hypothetical protein
VATLIHITKAENESSIVRNGVKVGKHNSGIYFMPRVPGFLISHQWARELKRSGVKNFIAVDFKLPKTEEVWFGKYIEGHSKVQLSQAVEEFMANEEQFGYEFFIERKILPSEISGIRTIPKPMGWRYEPNAHGKEPCPCPVCIQAGGFKTANLKERREPKTSREEARETLLHSNDEDKLVEALERMQGKWRKESPEYLKRFLQSTDEYVLYALVELLAEHRHPLAKSYLSILAGSEDEDSSELARKCLQRI